jgi:hypothetical protein
MRAPFCKLGTHKNTRMYVLQKRLKVCGVGFFKYREHTGVRGDSLTWTGCKMYEMRSLLANEFQSAHWRLELPFWEAWESRKLKKRNSCCSDCFGKLIQPSEMWSIYMSNQILVHLCKHYTANYNSVLLFIFFRAFGFLQFYLIEFQQI